ncbi:flagellar protein FlaG [Myxococcota bacterium]|nr:flagellar protein FlaG [Myxococcota bacterium]MBU1430405.1 flagellar protein FlaG [Myxococcota bacterium]MBU1898741.1 flagellar protein FlaG [Myxococcota bacterium]
MAVQFNKNYVVQALRPAYGHEGLGALRAQKTEGGSETEMPKGPEGAEAIEAGGAARAPKEITPQALTKAVEEANQLAESALAATNRKISFNVHDSGQVVISIEEKHGEESITREIPPQEMLDMMERLRSLRDEQLALRGSLVNIDA